MRVGLALRSAEIYLVLFDVSYRTETLVHPLERTLENFHFFG